MNAKNGSRRAWLAGGFCTVVGALTLLVTLATRDSTAADFKFWPFGCGKQRHACSEADCGKEEFGPGGTWYWVHSPDEEKRFVAGIFNRYCIRCHGQDGRGVWDIPDVPNFTNPRWQESRSDGQIARIILEGRGAVMPPFRGTLSLEESWAMARYLRTFVPGTEASRPDLNKPATPEKKAPEPGKEK